MYRGRDSRAGQGRARHGARAVSGARQGKRTGQGRVGLDKTAGHLDHCSAGVWVCLECTETAVCMAIAVCTGTEARTGTAVCTGTVRYRETARHAGRGAVGVTRSSPCKRGSHHGEWVAPTLWVWGEGS
jgi:hypothetical protein